MASSKKIALIKRDYKSWTQFAQEYFLYDTEVSSKVRFLGAFEMPSFDDVINNEIEYEVDSSWVRLTHIANSMYGDEAFWWVIAARNGLDLPDADLYEGMKLKIPTKSYVMTKFVRSESVTVEE